MIDIIEIKKETEGIICDGNTPGVKITLTLNPEPINDENFVVKLKRSRFKKKLNLSIGLNKDKLMIYCVEELENEVFTFLKRTNLFSFVVKK